MSDGDAEKDIMILKESIAHCSEIHAKLEESHLEMIKVKSVFIEQLNELLENIDK